MVSISYVGQLGAGNPTFSTNVTDLAVCWINGHAYLYSATLPGPGAGLASYDIGQISGGGSLVALQGYNAAVLHATEPQIALVATGAGTGANLIAAGLTPSGWASYSIGTSGAFGSALNSPFAFNPTAVTSATIGGANYVFLAAAGGDAPLSYLLQDSGGMVAVTGPSLSGLTGPNIDNMAVASLGGQSYLLTASSSGNLLTSHTISADGHLAAADSVTSADTVGMSRPTEVSTFTLHGNTYAVVAGAESSSLSVFKVLPGGALFAVDHIVDDLNTRFAGATALTTLQIGDRTFVLAGGSDDGIEVLTALPDGRLIHLLTVQDSGNLSLADVSAIAAAYVSGKVKVFVASGTEPGISQFELNLGTFGTSLFQNAGVMNGTAFNDMLFSGSATTAVYGGQGDDIIVGGGASAALLYGGAGSDTFVLSANPSGITIKDYEVGIDQLDLTSFMLLRNLGQLTITSTASGADISYFSTTIHIESFDGNPLAASAFAQSQILNLTRFPPIQTTDLISGTNGPDSLSATSASTALIGLAGNDSLTGGSGNDLLQGDDGNDLLFGGAGNDFLSGGTGDDSLYGGDLQDRLEGDQGNDLLDGGAGNDSLAGGSGNDVLSDSFGNNLFDGGDGDDQLTAGTGDDSLYGGAGNDRLLGGDGLNFLDGGEDADVILGGGQSDTALGGSGDDFLSGAAGNDSLSGDAGSDTLAGGDGNDLLHGNAGDDLIVGGNGHDQLFGDADNDMLWDSLGNDSLYGGDGQDTLIGGDGANLLDGGRGDDFLFGGQHAESLYGGDGAEYADAGAGNDSLYGGNGTDRLNGGLGDDLLHGDAGQDSLAGGDGNDQLYGDADNDLLFGDVGDDSLYGGAGNDRLIGGDGANLISGGADDDLIYGGVNADRLQGDTGQDILVGAGGNDRLDGGDGNDLLFGGDGTDDLFGGRGEDLFAYRAASDIGSAASGDVIHDFTSGEDKLDLTGMGLHLGGPGQVGAEDAISFFTQGAFLVLQADIDGDGLADFSLHLENVSAISASDFLF